MLRYGAANDRFSHCLGACSRTAEIRCFVCNNLCRNQSVANVLMGKRGNKGGRKPALDAKAFKQVRALMADRSTRQTDIAAQYKISKSTLYKLVRQPQTDEAC